MMRSFFLALALTLVCAGTSQAQERAAAPQTRELPAGMLDAANASAAARSGARKASPAVRASRTPAGTRQHAPRVKRPAAPRS